MCSSNSGHLAVFFSASYHPIGLPTMHKFAPRRELDVSERRSSIYTRSGRRNANNAESVVIAYLGPTTLSKAICACVNFAKKKIRDLLYEVGTRFIEVSYHTRNSLALQI